MILVDTREQSNKFVTDYFDKNHIEYKSQKLDVGDYKIEGQDGIVVERKKDLLELAGNVCSKDHERFKRELLRAKEQGIKVYVVVGDYKIKHLFGVKYWKSKRTQVKGVTLMKALLTIKYRYGVEYVFDKPSNIGFQIYKILTTKGEPPMQVKDNWIYFDKPKMHKKITGTKFPVLIDKNPFTKKGEQVLEMLGVVAKEPIDPYYLVRGDIGEAIAKKFFESYNWTCQTWKKEEINYDNFPMNKDFGGMIDIAITSPQRTVIEVKTKNIKDYDKIKQYGNPHEEYQGMLYATLCESDCILIWIFFNDETERLIRANQSKTTDEILSMIDLNGVNDKGKRNVTIYMKNEKMEENAPMVKDQMEIAKAYYDKCYAECRVPIYDVSQKFLVEHNLLNENSKPF